MEKRKLTSHFCGIPNTNLTERINAQLALRHEDFSDSKSATVGKFALGYEVNNSSVL